MIIIIIIISSSITIIIINKDLNYYNLLARCGVRENN